MEARRRVLVVANETVTGDELHEAIRQAGGEVLVVAPALNSRLRHWVSDVDRARRGAEERLQDCIDRLAAHGIEARGWVGDGDPLQAIEDSLKLYAADELIIATHPEGRSNWLERDLVQKARARFHQPIRHVVVSPLEARV
jgi:nucleotide-binding universal stress UspA family protein